MKPRVGGNGLRLAGERHWQVSVYSSRKTTVRHGTDQLHLFFLNLAAAIFFTLVGGPDYLVIYFASGLFHLAMELLLAFTGGRKGDVFVYGRKLPKSAHSVLRAFVEGPGICVPAFYAADRLFVGDTWPGLLVPAALMGVAALYSGLADYLALRRLEDGEGVVWSRRKMTRPFVVMTVAFVGTTCLILVMLMPEPHRTHAIIYLIAYTALTMLWFLINYAFGVRMIQRFDEERQEFYTPGIGFELVAFFYDSANEMALLISPVYLIPYAARWLQFATILQP